MALEVVVGGERPRIPNLTNASDHREVSAMQQNVAIGHDERMPEVRVRDEHEAHYVHFR